MIEVGGAILEESVIMQTGYLWLGGLVNLGFHLICAWSITATVLGVYRLVLAIVYIGQLITMLFRLLREDKPLLIVVILWVELNNTRRQFDGRGGGRNRRHA